MTDWQTMEAGKAMDILIADKVGWKIVSRPFGKQVDGYLFGFEYNLMTPQGVLLWENNADQGWRFRASDVWANATKYWEPSLPDYSTSVDAALTLLPPSDFVLLEISGEDGEWKVSLYIGSTSKGAFTAQTLALAICRAWLAWKEAEG